MTTRKTTPVFAATKLNARQGELEISAPIDAEESWWYDTVTPSGVKRAVRAMGDVEEIVLRINSPGGNVFAGIEIYNYLKDHPAKVTARVTGLAASAASFIAMAGDEIVMATGSMMMVHSPWSGSVGNADDHRRHADFLDKVGDSMISIYKAKTGKSEEDLKALLSDETWFTADEAVKEGFADRRDETAKVSASLKDGVATFGSQRFDLRAMASLPKLSAYLPEEPEPSPIATEPPPAPAAKAEPPTPNKPAAQAGGGADPKVNEEEVKKQTAALAAANGLLGNVRAALNLSEDGDVVAYLKVLQAKAADGDAYKEKLIDQACGAGVRALGEAFSVDVMKATYAALPVAEIEKINAAYEKQASAILGGGGRHSQGDDPGVPAGLAANASGAPGNPQAGAQKTPEQLQQEKQEQAAAAARAALQESGFGGIMKGAN